MPKNRRRVAVVLGASALVTAGMAAPAHAGDTTTTFTLAGGSLSISEPASADLGSANTGAASISGNLGSVTVTDDRGLLVAAWTVDVESTDFTTGTASAAETVAATNVTYTPGTTTGNAVTVPAPGALGGAVPLPVMTGSSVGNNSATWDPTILIALPAQAVVGTYSGTITHSVS